MKKKDNKPAALDHVLYEIEMLVTSVMMLARGLPGFESSGWLEVFAVHTRNLNEFFGDKVEGGGHMKPNHFFSDWNDSYLLDTSIVRRANSQVAHLTYDRETPEEKTGWPVVLYFTNLRGPSLAFLKRAHADTQLMAYSKNKVRTDELLAVLSKIQLASDVGARANIADAPVMISRSHPSGGVA